MKNKELHNSFSEEVKQNPAKCKTQEEVKKGSEEADVRHLDDEVCWKPSRVVFVPFFPCWKINSAKSREKLIAGGTQMEKNNAGGDLYELQ